MSGWEERYQIGNTPWDLGGPSPVVQRLARTVLGPGARVLVPGCGRGHDAEALARAGFVVTGLDLSPTALAEAAARVGALDDLEWLAGDLFALPEARPEAYDAVVEHTCYCALERDLLDAYRDAVWGLLRPGGHLLGAFLHFDDAGGPGPHGTSPAALRARFEPRFRVVRLAPAAEQFAPRGVPQLEGVFQKVE
ncbi:MAG: methyltransferase domain-containing protein [Myxococcales bacterium]|nr:methyltransferase domain-containing protein [Myxococcales bacterium]